MSVCRHERFARPIDDRCIVQKAVGDLPMNRLASGLGESMGIHGDRAVTPPPRDASGAARYNRGPTAVRFASLFNLLFSTGGLLIVLLVLSIGLLLRPRSRAVRVAMLCAVAWYYLISLYPVPNYIGRLWSAPFEPFSRSDLPAGRTAIALLGSGSYTALDWQNARTAVPDPIGLARTLEAARVYALVEPAWVISSGGIVEPGLPDISPGVAMQETLVRLGVPASRIIVKDQAMDTHDEAQNVARLVSSLGLQHVVLVTSAIHMRRALATFRAAGVPAIPAPARERPPRLFRSVYLPNQIALYESSLVAHELFGFAYYRMRGWN